MAAIVLLVYETAKLTKSNTVHPNPKRSHKLAQSLLKIPGIADGGYFKLSIVSLFESLLVFQRRWIAQNVTGNIKFYRTMQPERTPFGGPRLSSLYRQGFLC